MPHKSESAGAYRTALDVYDRQTAKQAAFRLGDLIKRVHK
jgi:hypothetical protein